MSRFTSRASLESRLEGGARRRHWRQGEIEAGQQGCKPMWNVRYAPLARRNRRSRPGEGRPKDPPTIVTVQRRYGILAINPKPDTCMRAPLGERAAGSRRALPGNDLSTFLPAALVPLASLRGASLKQDRNANSSRESSFLRSRLPEAVLLPRWSGHDKRDPSRRRIFGAFIYNWEFCQNS